MVSRGSTSNIDAQAELLSTGHSQIKAFNLTNITNVGYDFATDGLRLGWGLRNSVGLAEHPLTGGIYSVENSVDQMTRDGKDVHQDNPGEEMNFHGYLNGTEDTVQGSNYGYPNCFAAWMPDDLPQNAKLVVGSQFAIGDQNDTVNDTFCAEKTPPRLTFQAHMAPLDIVFNNTGTEGWVTFHGSWYVQTDMLWKMQSLTSILLILNCFIPTLTSQIVGCIFGSFMLRTLQLWFLFELPCPRSPWSNHIRLPSVFLFIELHVWVFLFLAITMSEEDGG